MIPAGLASRDSLRLEAGMPLYGHELGLEITPFESGLGRLVEIALEKKAADFVGREALTELAKSRVEAHPGWFEGSGEASCSCRF